MSVALLCPGQGSQRVGMAKDLAETFPEARAVLEAVDEALGFALSAVMWNGPALVEHPEFGPYLEKWVENE